jgi:hypothetical protein
MFAETCASSLIRELVPHIIDVDGIASEKAKV